MHLIFIYVYNASMIIIISILIVKYIFMLIENYIQNIMREQI